MTGKLIFSLLIMLIAITTCEDNNDSGGNGSCPTIPFFTIRLTEDSPYETGVPTVATTQTYSYKRGQLVGLTTVQSYSVQNEPVKIENTTSVTYEEHQAITTDDFGSVSTCFLNGKGYAIQCARQEVSATRTHDFSYFTSPEGKPYLKDITESINGKVHASIDIDYSSPQTLRIMQKVDTYTQAYAATASAGNNVTSQSEVPYLFFADLYPLSLHSTALYGKLLGEPFSILIEQITPDGDTTSQGVRRYICSLNRRNIITSCKEATSSYGTNYIRTVNYVIE